MQQQLAYPLLISLKGNFPSAEAVKVHGAADVWQEDLPETGKLSGDELDPKTDPVTDTTSAAAAAGGLTSVAPIGDDGRVKCGVRMTEEHQRTGTEQPIAVVGS